MVFHGHTSNLIEEFIRAQTNSRDLDERTEKAYRQDLELFFRWLEAYGKDGDGGFVSESALPGQCWVERMEDYLNYLSKDRGLRSSTLWRRQQVFGYYLSYLKAQHVIEGFRPLKIPGQEEEVSADTQMTRQEVDAFFQAIDKEYGELESDFRRRVCLRDQVMMKLLFYHGVEISELLRMEATDYDRKNHILTIRRKKERNREVSLFSLALQEQMERWLDEHGYFEHGKGYDGRMFLSKLGKPLSMKMVTNIFDKYRVLAGIEKECTPKDLKGSFGRYAQEIAMELGI